MKLAVLDARTFGEDISTERFAAFGEVTVYNQTEPEEVVSRLAGCEVAVLNKVILSREMLQKIPSLRLICVTATGYDNVDREGCRENGVALCNVPGYSTDSVAQVTAALALSLVTHLPDYVRHVSSGAYTAGGVHNHLTPVYHELAGKTWGIAGLGHIGRKVAQIAGAFGCRVIACKRTPDANIPCVTLAELCRQSDVLSLHLPLSEATRNCLDAACLALMKPSAVLINVARGALLDEESVARAIETGRLGGFGSDVYDGEPLSADSPLRRIVGRPNVLLTPHMAWGAYEARVRCLRETEENIRAFERGERRNRVDL